MMQSSVDPGDPGAGGLDAAEKAADEVRHAQRRSFLAKTVGVLLVLLFVGAGFGVAWTVIPIDPPAPTPEVTRTVSGDVTYHIRDRVTQAEIDRRRYTRFGILGGAAILGIAAGAFAYSRLSRGAGSAD